MLNPTKSLFDLLPILARYPGATAQDLSLETGRSAASIKNDLYKALLPDMKESYTTNVKVNDRRMWFLTERGRQYVRRRGMELANDFRPLPDNVQCMIKPVWARA